ncbi:MAG: hypothetical protein IPM81_05295 [Saprospirales bacterium]|jgi:hypothetical protein|nr:hypothetical protein [Saprospirales bacterium]
MVVVKVADYDVADKVDTQYVETHLPDLPGIGIIFICTSEGGDDDDWTDEEGTRHIVIQLPYKVVLQLPDVRPLMLEKAKERLGAVG